MTAARKALEALAKADADVKDAADSKAWRIASDTQHHLRVNLSAPLAAVVRAAMDRREAEDAYAAAERKLRGFNPLHAKVCETRAAMADALDAFEAEARAQGVAP